jgi:hypothetical protein
VTGFGEVIGLGVPPGPEFWIGPRAAGGGVCETHIAFAAPGRAAVRAWFQAAVSVDAAVLHEPRVWPGYRPGY